MKSKRIAARGAKITLRSQGWFWSDGCTDATVVVPRATEVLMIEGTGVARWSEVKELLQAHVSRMKYCHVPGGAPGTVRAATVTEVQNLSEVLRCGGERLCTWETRGGLELAIAEPSKDQAGQPDPVQKRSGSWEFSDGSSDLVRERAAEPAADGRESSIPEKSDSAREGVAEPATDGRESSIPEPEEFTIRIVTGIDDGPLKGRKSWQQIVGRRDTSGRLRIEQAWKAYPTDMNTFVWWSCGDGPSWVQQDCELPPLNAQFLLRNAGGAVGKSFSVEVEVVGSAATAVGPALGAKLGALGTGLLLIVRGASLALFVVGLAVGGVVGHATAARATPTIDYRFVVSMGANGRWRLEGEHDPFPSYVVELKGAGEQDAFKTIYSYRHKKWTKRAWFEKFVQPFTGDGRAAFGLPRIMTDVIVACWGDKERIKCRGKL